MQLRTDPASLEKNIEKYQITIRTILKTAGVDNATIRLSEFEGYSLQVDLEKASKKVDVLDLTKSLREMCDLGWYVSDIQLGEQKHGRRTANR